MPTISETDTNGVIKIVVPIISETDTNGLLSLVKGSTSTWTAPICRALNFFLRGFRSFEFKSSLVLVSHPMEWVFLEIFIK